MGLFGNDKKSQEKIKEKVHEICGKLRTESRRLDRQIMAIEREEQKTIALIKDAAKKNQLDVCKISAKGLIQSKKHKARIYATKAHMNSIIMQMKNQLAQTKMAGSIKSSNEVMQSMSNLIKMPELQRIMTEMSKEMMKVGIIDEMIQESLDSALDQDVDIDDILDAEIDKIILEVTQNKLRELPTISSSTPTSLQESNSILSDVQEGSNDQDMSRRLEALKSV